MVRHDLTWMYGKFFCFLNSIKDFFSLLNAHHYHHMLGEIIKTVVTSLIFKILQNIKEFSSLLFLLDFVVLLLLLLVVFFIFVFQFCALIILWVDNTQNCGIQQFWLFSSAYLERQAKPYWRHCLFKLFFKKQGMWMGWEKL